MYSSKKPTITVNSTPNEENPIHPVTALPITTALEGIRQPQQAPGSTRLEPHNSGISSNVTAVQTSDNNSEYDPDEEEIRNKFKENRERIRESLNDPDSKK
jgi:hypothetical protein